MSVSYANTGTHNIMIAQVSMVPPLFLDVQPGALVLDMCAAPGSKTVQLLEAVSTGGNTDGLVVANDVNRDRAYLLSHQCKRVSSPCLCVTWCAAQVSAELVLLGVLLRSSDCNCSLCCCARGQKSCRSCADFLYRNYLRALRRVFACSCYMNADCAKVYSRY